MFGEHCLSNRRFSFMFVEVAGRLRTFRRICKGRLVLGHSWLMDLSVCRYSFYNPVMGAQ